jgi:hypothetical protein
LIDGRAANGAFVDDAGERQFHFADRDATHTYESADRGVAARLAGLARRRGEFHVDDEKPSEVPEGAVACHA